jgi:hypothetical protein
MEQEIQDLTELPLSSLMSGPINAVIEAQATAAMTTANFIQQVGFDNTTNADHSIFDILTGGSAQPERLKMRTAELSFAKKQVKADGSVEDVDETVQLPFISLFNVPSFEINRLTWSFNARLKRMEAFQTDLTVSAENKRTVHVASKLSVESTRKTDFDLRYGLGREHEYNLQINVEASSGPAPRGIERLLAIAEKIAASNEAAAAATTTTSTTSGS